MHVFIYYVAPICLLFYAMYLSINEALLDFVCIVVGVTTVQVLLACLGRMIRTLFVYIRRSPMATGTAYTALVGYVEVWSLIKRLRMLMIHCNVHSVNINVSMPYIFTLLCWSYGFNLIV